MEALLNFLVTYKNWIYGILALVGLIYLKKLIQSVIEWRSTIFGLEREAAQRRLNSSLVMVIITFLLFLMEFVSVTFIINEFPQVPQLAPLNNPADGTLDIGIVVPTAANPENGAIGLPSVAAADQIILPISASGGCIPGEIEWVSPKPGEEISGVYELKATINIPDLGFYKYEYAPIGEQQNWNAVSAGSTPMIENTLGVLATTEILNGDYVLRLIVVDKANQEKAPCDVGIRIMNQVD